MRGCLGLLLLFAATAGCASPDSESPGFFGNYGGFPWPSLLRKNSDQINDDSYNPPTYRGAGRFAQPARSVGRVSANPAASSQDPAVQAAADQVPAAE